MYWLFLGLVWLASVVAITVIVLVIIAVVVVVTTWLWGDAAW